jgi:hypothetical protein
MSVYWLTTSISRGRGIKIEAVDHFNARGMRLVFGRSDRFPLDGKRYYKRNMGIWLTREGRVLARFWARGREVDDESLELIGLSLPYVPDRGSCLSEDWVPEKLRSAYDAWLISNAETPLSAYGL